MTIKRQKWARRFLLVAVALFALVGAAYMSLGFRTLRFDSELESWTETLSAYDALLAQSVTGSGVDYGALRTLRSTGGYSIEDVAGYLSSHGPVSDPEEFTSEEGRLAYAINAYNILVLAAVTRLAPESSIHEIHGLIEIEPGFGFFYALQFEVDGTTTNLYDFENEVLREFGDARVHAAINCASRSCPGLRPAGFRADDLGAQLDEAMRVFVGDPRHVDVNEQEGVVSVSAIFAWYRDDFVPNSSSLADVLPFIQQHGGSFEKPDLDYRVVELPYDWGLASSPAR